MPLSQNLHGQSCETIYPVDLSERVIRIPGLGEEESGRPHDPHHCTNQQNGGEQRNSETGEEDSLDMDHCEEWAGP